MAKIPKNLSDKDMFKDYKEEKTLETMFLEAEEKSAKAKPAKKTAADIKIAYLTQDVIDSLGKMLLQLKLDFYKEGTVDYTMKIEREGNKIVLYPAPKK